MLLNLVPKISAMLRLLKMHLLIFSIDLQKKNERAVMKARGNISIELLHLFALFADWFHEGLILGLARIPEHKWDGQRGQGHHSKCSPVKLKKNIFNNTYFIE
jgi:hypothetical protein